MMIVIETCPGFDSVVADLSETGRKIIAAAAKGLETGAKVAANTVAADYLSGQSLKWRSGRLAGAVDSWMLGPLEAVVGVPENSQVDKYKWLLGDEAMTIRPKNSKFLAIPIGENLTAGGVQFDSPYDKPDGFFVRKSGSLLFGYRRGKTKRAKFRALFVLVKSVLVQGSGALADGVLKSTDNIAASMQAEIDKVIP